MHVLLDEAFDPEPAVCGVLLAGAEISLADSLIRKEVARLREKEYLYGLSSFDEFMERGPHATSDTLEVYLQFGDLLSGLPGQAFIYATRKKALPKRHRGNASTAAILYVSLLRVILQKERNAAGVHLHFEQHEELNGKFPAIAALAARQARYKGPLKVSYGPKGEPASLMMPDYILHFYGRVSVLRSRESVSINDAAYRNWRGVSEYISSIYSLSDGLVASRRRGVLQWS